MSQQKELWVISFSEVSTDARSVDKGCSEVRLLTTHYALLGQIRMRDLGQSSVLKKTTFFFCFEKSYLKKIYEWPLRASILFTLQKVIKYSFNLQFMVLIR